jgi:LPS-assembly protein
MRLTKSHILLPILSALLAVTVAAQQTNPVDRRVSNPITDSKTVNPVGSEAYARSRVVDSDPVEGGGDELVVYSMRQSVEGDEGGRVITHSGKVDVRYGVYRLQADKIVIYEADGRMVAEGNVIFDQRNEQRIGGESGEWNYRTKLGRFVKSSGFTNQTVDGDVVFFTADLVERISLDEVVVSNGKFTSCQEDVPKWSFTAGEARIRLNDRIRLSNVRFRVLDRTLVPLPFVSIPIDRTSRASGFLLPSGGFSARKGYRLSSAYYQTLGPSADVTFRADIFTARGVGFGFDARTRANDRSFLNFGFYGVKDRFFGAKAGPSTPDQGGSVVFAEGVHYFENGFAGAVDVRLTSNLEFRQVFSDGIQQIISPIEVSQGFVTRSWGNFTLDLLARSQVISIPNVRIRTRNLPSVHFEKRPSELGFLPNVFLSFRTAADGVSRRDEADDIGAYRVKTGSDPVNSPSLGQRLDIHPLISIPLSSRYLNVTTTFGGRLTYYSNSFNDMRQVVGRDLLRKYGEVEIDIRPVALARNFYGGSNGFRFRHVIEAYATYRRIGGVRDFARTIRHDHIDTVSDTDEVEFGVSNRFFTRRYPGKTDVADGGAAKDPSTAQPFETFTLSVRGKYFLDPRFGGALTPGRRNQLSAITGLTFYSFGGIPRRWSPLSVTMTYRPSGKVFIDSRTDIGLNGDGVRAVSATVGLERPLLKLYQSFYYTRAVTLVPSLFAFASADGKEPGSLRGSQWNPSVFLGDRDLGWFGGASLYFDFQNRRGLGGRPLISSLYTVGYAYDCCSLAVQYYTFNVGVRRENRFVFSVKLNGLGSFGTEQYGQGLK